MMNYTEANGEMKDTSKRQSSIKRIKRKLPACLIAGFSLPVTLFLYGPFDLFAQNRAEFAFSLYDFILPCILLTVLCGLILSAIPLFLRRRVFAVYMAVLFWLSAMLYIQGSYLNAGYTSLAADGLSASPPLALVILNTLIWLVTLAAVIFAVLAFNSFRKKIKSVAALGLALVFVMEGVGFAVVSFNEGVYHKREQVIASDLGESERKMLTTRGLTELSDNKNIVVFLVDRFDATYYERAVREQGELFSELEGFTYYSDHTSLYARTFPAVTYMLTGKEKPSDMSRKEYFKDAWENAQPLDFLAEQGYDVNIYTQSFYAYDNAAYMDGYADNVTSYSSYEITDKAALFGSMLTFSLYRYLPFCLKFTADGLGSESFNGLIEYQSPDNEEKYLTDSKKVYEQLTQSDFSLVESTGRFTFLHIEGCHAPSPYGEGFEVLDEPSYDVSAMMSQSFKIINRYLSEMKRLGVYENATVIITGDHASAISDSKPVSGSRLTTLLLKPSGESEGGVRTNFAPTSQEDLWKTIFESEGFEAYPNVQGSNLIGIDSHSERERRYIFHRIDGDETEEIIYKIKGSGRDFANWQIDSRRDIPKIYN